MKEKKGPEIRISKECPECGWRVLDKITPTSGVIEMKCPRCHKAIKLDLAYRISGTGNLRSRLYAM